MGFLNLFSPEIQNLPDSELGRFKKEMAFDLKNLIAAVNHILTTGKCRGGSKNIFQERPYIILEVFLTRLWILTTISCALVT